MAFDIPAVPGFAFGGDYSAEQWPEEVWADDMRLMKAAGVNLVTVGVFAWAMLETAPGRYEFGWLDRLLDQLAAHGVAVDLATATASPPPWFSYAHPDSLIPPQRITVAARRSDLTAFGTPVREPQAQR